MCSNISFGALKQHTLQKNVRHWPKVITLHNNDIIITIIKTSIRGHTYTVTNPAQIVTYDLNIGSRSHHS